MGWRALSFVSTLYCLLHAALIHAQCQLSKYSPLFFSQVRNAAVDYVDVRARVANAFPEKAHEMSALITVLQTLSKETAALTESIHAHCGVKMSAKPIANRTS